MTILNTEKDTTHINVNDFSDSAQAIGRTVPVNIARAASDLYDQLKRVQGWLFVDLLNPDNPVNKDSAAKALAEINTLLNRLEN